MGLVLLAGLVIILGLLAEAGWLLCFVLGLMGLAGRQEGAALCFFAIGFIWCIASLC